MIKYFIRFNLLIIIIFAVCANGELYAQNNGGTSYVVKRYDFTLRMKDSVLIDCTKFIPEEKKPAEGWPVIMFCHGFSESKETEIPDAMDQAQFGYYTFTYSMRGSGAFRGIVKSDFYYRDE